jgi:PAS domain S-box-containing protein
MRPACRKKPDIDPCPERERQALLDVVREGICGVDGSGTVAYVNSRLCELTGFSQAQLVGKSIFAIIGGESEIARAARLRSLESLPDRSEFSLLRSGRDPLRASYSSKKLMGKNGAEERVFAISDDSGSRKAEDAYRIMMDSPCLGFALLLGGEIIRCNAPMAEMLASVDPRERAAFFSPLGAERSRMICYTDSNGRARAADLTSVATEYEGMPALILACVPIEQRQRAEELVQESDARFDSLLECAPVAIGVSRAENTLYANPSFLELFRIPGPAQAVDRLMTNFAAPRHRKEMAESLRDCGGKDGLRSEFDIVAKRFDGSTFPCRVATVKLTLRDGPAMLAFCFDLTEQKESASQLEASRTKLSNLAAYLLHAREEERKTIAREIHDEIGQILTAIKMDIQWIKKRVGRQVPQVADKITGLVGLTDQTIQMVHRISTELRPGILDDLGLDAAIEWLCADFSHRNGMPCRVDITASGEKLGGTNATAIFRIVQESLNNVQSHAQATQASVEIFEEDGRLCIIIEDDGIGVKEKEASSLMAFGLIGMRERVQGMHGAISIKGRPGKGTKVSIAIPLSAESWSK